MTDVIIQLLDNLLIWMNAQSVTFNNMYIERIGAEWEMRNHLQTEDWTGFNTRLSTYKWRCMSKY